MFVVAKLLFMLFMVWWWNASANGPWNNWYVSPHKQVESKIMDSIHLGLWLLNLSIKEEAYKHTGSIQPVVELHFVWQYDKLIHFDYLICNAILRYRWSIQDFPCHKEILDYFVQAKKLILFICELWSYTM